MARALKLLYVQEVERVIDNGEGGDDEQEKLRNMTRTRLSECDMFQNTPFLLACYNEAPLPSILQLLYLSEVTFDDEEGSMFVLTNAETNHGASAEVCGFWIFLRY